MSEGKREADVEFPSIPVGGGGGGYGYFLALHNVILFKNKVNRRSIESNQKQAGGLPYERGSGDARRKF